MRKLFVLILLFTFLSPLKINAENMPSKTEKLVSSYLDSVRSLDFDYEDLDLTPQELEAVFDAQKDNKTLLIPISEPAYYNSLNNTGLERLHVELLQEIFDIELDVTISSDFSASYSQMLNGEYDFATTFSYTKERTKFFDYSIIPYGQDFMSLSYLEDVPNPTNDILNTAVVGYHAGTAFGEKLENLNINNIVEVHPDDFIEKLRSGEIDYYFTTFSFAFSYSKDEDDIITKNSTRVIHDDSISLISPKNYNPQLLSAFSKAYSYGLSDILIDYQYQNLNIDLYETFLNFLTEEELSYLYNSTSIDVGTLIIPPYVYLDDGYLTGLNIDIIKHFSKNTGLEINFRSDIINRWDKTLSFVKSGDIHFAAAALNIPSRLNDYRFIGPIYSDTSVLIGNSDNEYEITSMYEVLSKKVGVVENFAHQPYYQKILGVDDGFFYTYPNLNELFKAISRNEIDFTIIGSNTYSAYLLENNFPNLKTYLVLPETLNEDIYMMFSKNENSDMIYSIMEKYYNIMNFDEVYNKWSNLVLSDNVMIDHASQQVLSERVTQFIIIGGLGSVLIFAILLAAFIIKRVYSTTLYDSLTKVSNRHALSKYSPKKDMVHIYFIDIDNFKDINDLYGHGVGDEVLKTIGERLKGLYGRNQSFRVGGDEFLIISESNYQTGIRNINLDENEVAAINSTKIIELITRPIFTNNHEIHIGVSIGVTYSKVEEDFVLSDFIQLADTAMYNAKKSGKGIYKILTPKALSEIKRVLQYEHDFIHAIEFNEITPVYQYTYDLSTNKPVDIEVYGRWYYKGEVLNPDFYLPIAHKYHLIKEHDLFVISKAFEDFKDKINEDLTITVNLSYHSFRRIKPELIKELADKSSINPKYICIDLPQKVFNDSNSINRLKIYDNYGFSLNMNQFNISYNTFEQLLLVSVKYIKLKRDFLEQNENEFKEMLNKNVLSTFKDLDLNIVFEGVENAEDLNYLRQHKIRYAKGYYFDRPDVYEKK